MITCDECGKQLKNTQGLNGHYRFAHKLNSPRSTERVPIAHATLATVGQLEELRAETVEQLAHVGEELKAKATSLVSAAAELLQQLGSAEQRQVDPAHGPGLCASGQCARCRDYRKGQGPVVWKQAQKALTDEIVAACEWAGVPGGWNEAVVAYRVHKDGGGDAEDVSSQTTMASLVEAMKDPEPLPADSETLDALESITLGDRAESLDASVSPAQGAPIPEPSLPPIPEPSLPPIPEPSLPPIPEPSLPPIAQDPPDPKVVMARAPDGTLIRVRVAQDRKVIVRGRDGRLSSG